MMPSSRRAEEEMEDAQQQQQQHATTNLLVRGPAGCLSLAVPGSLRVEELKTQLALATGITVDDQFLMYQCKLLQDSAALALYGLGSDGEEAALTSRHLPTVEMGVRQRGGCFMVTFTLLTILFFATLCAPFTCGTSLCLYVFLLPPCFILPFFFL